MCLVNKNFEAKVVYVGIYDQHVGILHYIRIKIKSHKDEIKPEFHNEGLPSEKTEKIIYPVQCYLLIQSIKVPIKDFITKNFQKSANTKLMKKRKGFITKNSTGSAFSSNSKSDSENESTSDSYSEDDSNYEAE